jgi:hypothetical protein
MVANDLDRVVEAADYRTSWGAWHHRESEFYIQCADLASRLEWEKIVSIAGPEVSALAKLATARLRALQQDRIPERLMLAPYTVMSATADTSRLCAQPGYDFVDVPTWLVRE